MTHQIRKCPCCEDIVLQHVEMHGQELDVCPKCNGIWFDDSELSEAIRHKNEIKDEYCIKQGFGEKLEQHTIVISVTFLCSNSICLKTII